MTVLDLSEVRELEDMVIESIYNGLISAKMDNKQQQLIVDYVSSRDFKIEDADELFSKLERWYKHIEEIEGSVERSLSETVAALKDSEEHKMQVTKRAKNSHKMAFEEISSQRRNKPLCDPMEDIENPGNPNN
eukprot:TRINITY_DN1329_c0_g2_i1.p2 TRINITY_DN1329_c0_g2~~TRINITY_DN1329_c0_g2_i1.p2  ORF type:complete len:133 (+),score=20.64 TRINITY_DN1329_c0_g2_i1:497-895(+)